MTADNGMEGPEPTPGMADGPPPPERVVLLRALGEAGQAMAGAGASLQASGHALMALATLLLRRPSEPAAPAKRPSADDESVIQFAGSGRADRATRSR